MYYDNTKNPLNFSPILLGTSPKTVHINSTQHHISAPSADITTVASEYKVVQIHFEINFFLNLFYELCGHMIA
jgi:hypothetical protein